MPRVLCILLALIAFSPVLRAQCASGQAEIDVIIVPDNFPNETTWEIKDKAGNLVASGGSTGQTLCVPDTLCFDFTIFDSYGDGICCNFGNGSYTVKWNGTIQASGGQFGLSETTSFGNCPPGSDCSFPDSAYVGTHTAPGRDHWYKFTPASTGQYHIHTCSAGCDTKIWMYDYCTGLVWDNSNAGTIYYNDDLCGTRSQIYPNLVGGQTYWIRIGDKNNACQGSIPWELIYLGPVRGCTDSLACNFEPLAQLPDTCFYPGDTNCPSGPDLMVVQSAIESSIYVTGLNNNDGCAIAEGCAGGYGQREIIRFDTHIKNIGDEDYFIGAPPSVPGQFTYDNCHAHWHYEGYAEYLLYDSNNNPLPIGFKNGFCVMDLECSGGGTYTYGCNNMGISAGCGDIYHAGLDCQWIDITDVPAGDYTLVVRVNWDRSPDALGRVERDYQNNWAQVCFTLSRAPGSGAPSISLNSNCPPVTDCMGVPLGTAQRDCNGVCNGTALHGDLDNNGQRTQNDAEIYVDNIIHNGPVSATSCVDLNNDGKVTVYDAAMVNGCGLFGGGHTHNGGGLHDHCKFPGGILNINDTVAFALSGIDYVAGYVDISVRNPRSALVGYQLKLSGISVTSVQSLVSSTGYPATIEFNSGGELIVINYDDSTIQKHTNHTQVLRVYYAGFTDSVVCIDEVVDVVNHKYEQTMTRVEGLCAPDSPVSVEDPQFADHIRVFPNPFREETRIEFPSSPGPGTIIEITDLNGKVLRTLEAGSSRSVIVPRGNLSSGIYLYRITGPVRATGKLLVY